MKKLGDYLLALSFLVFLTLGCTGELLLAAMGVFQLAAVAITRRLILGKTKANTFDIK